MNNITITGNLTESKGITRTPNSFVAKRSIAENFSQNDKQFTDLEAWGTVADQLHAMPKGSYVTVSGFLKHGSYQAKDGTNRRTTHVVVKSVTVAEKPAKKAAPAADAPADAAPEEQPDEVVF